jgi:hypothetical protein
MTNFIDYTVFHLPFVCLSMFKNINLGNILYPTGKKTLDGVCTILSGSLSFRRRS